MLFPLPFCRSFTVNREGAPMDISQISAAVGIATNLAKLVSGTLRTATDADALKLFAELRNDFIDLQSKLLAAQGEYQQLTDINRTLERTIEAHDQWSAESKCYELRQIADGVFVYASKPNHRQSEPPHRLCPNCFEQKKKSIMCKIHVDYGTHKCHTCGFQFNLGSES